MIVYVSIGNSDDKLSQIFWAQFVRELRSYLRTQTDKIHGEWYSASDSEYQNACFCIESKAGDMKGLKEQLVRLKKYYNQESIAWVVAETEFL